MILLLVVVLALLIVLSASYYKTKKLVSSKFDKLEIGIETAEAQYRNTCQVNDIKLSEHVNSAKEELNENRHVIESLHNTIADMSIEIEYLKNKIAELDKTKANKRTKKNPSTK